MAWCPRPSLPSSPSIYSPLSVSSFPVIILNFHSLNSLSVFVPSCLHVRSTGHQPPPAQPLHVLRPHSHRVVPQSVISSTMAKDLTEVESSPVPFRLASSGFMSKTSTPCILPRISRRSRPVDWSRSVGTVPGSAPGGRRSCSVFISEEEGIESAYWLSVKRERTGRGRAEMSDK